MKKSLTPDIDEALAAAIWSRCHEDGDCLLWDGAVAGNKAGPAMTDPATGKTAPARRVLMKALGMPIAGLIATTSCQHPLCMERAHLLALTRKQLQQRSGPKLSANVVRSARLAELSRARSYLDMETVRAIRASGLRAKQAAEKWGIPLQTASRLIRHDSWRETTGNPFAGLGAANDTRRAA